MTWSLYRVENIVAKAEIAHIEQLHLSPQCFQKLSDRSKCDCQSERVSIFYEIEVTFFKRFIIKSINPFSHANTFWPIDLQQMAFRNIVAKVEIAQNKQFLPEPALINKYISSLGHYP